MTNQKMHEFCTLAFIGLVADFFLQLTFYVPCLTFDLLRFDVTEKRQLELVQLTKDPVTLKQFPPVKCPFRSKFLSTSQNDSRKTATK